MKGHCQAIRSHVTDYKTHAAPDLPLRIILCTWATSDIKERNDINICLYFFKKSQYVHEKG